MATIAGPRVRNPPLPNFHETRDKLHTRLTTQIRTLRSRTGHLEEISEGMLNLTRHLQRYQQATTRQLHSRCFDRKCSLITSHLREYAHTLHVNPQYWREALAVLEMIRIQVGRLTLMGENSGDEFAQRSEVLAERMENSLLPSRGDDALEEGRKRHLYAIWARLTDTYVHGCFCAPCRGYAERSAQNDGESSQDERSEGNGDDELSRSFRRVLRVTNP